jgi:hypothetical protein
MNARISRTLVRRLSISKVSAFSLLALWAPFNQADGYAQATSYLSRSEFNSALSASTTLNFEELPPSSAFSTGTSPIVSSGVTFTNSEYRLFVTSPGGFDHLYPKPGTGQYLWNFDSSYPVGIYLPAGMTAFGADFSGGIQPQTSFNATLTAILNGGQSYTYNFSGPEGSWTFFGVTFTDTIVGLVYDDGGNYLPIGTHEEMVDNVTFGTTIPEPGTWVLMLLGATAMLYFGHRRIRA